SALSYHLFNPSTLSRSIFSRNTEIHITMVATAATASLFPISSSQPESVAKNSGKHGGGGQNTVDMHGIKPKSRGLQVKTNAQAPTKVN
ncbi:hypothetical protein GUI04_17095, partial [Xanthomonas citri pv. citri]|nr:hypothetical protein [Xanthomonas citri pv. citri]